jgi:hypothetical protein
MNLECSSKGDKRFSALYAKINNISIEDRYQLLKKFLYNQKILHPENFKQAKHWQYKNEYKLIDFKVNNQIFSLKYLTAYYKYLWYIYLVSNKQLVNYIKKFDTFTDCFAKENTINSQKDIIEQVAKEGLNSLYEDCKFFVHKFCF